MTTHRVKFSNIVGTVLDTVCVEAVDEDEALERARDQSIAGDRLDVVTEVTVEPAIFGEEQIAAISSLVQLFAEHGYEVPGLSVRMVA